MFETYIEDSNGKIHTTYEHYLLSKHWKKKKVAYYNIYKKECSICGSRNNLNLHHITYKRVGKERLNDLVCLCHECHEKVHKGLVKVPTRSMIDKNDKLDFVKARESKCNTKTKKKKKKAKAKKQYTQTKKLRQDEYIARAKKVDALRKECKYIIKQHEFPRITVQKLQMQTNSSFGKSMLSICYNNWITAGNAEIRCIDKEKKLIELKHNGVTTTYQLF